MPVSSHTVTCVSANQWEKHSYFVTDHRQAFQESHFVPGLPQETIWLHEERLRF
jgi:hypothetical protein